MDGLGALVAGTTAFAILITKLVDFCRNAFDAHDKAPKFIWNVLALGLGIAVALIFELNMFGNVSGSKVQEVLGQVLTGLGMGATGSGWHEVLDALSGTAKKPYPPAAPGDKQLSDLMGRSE
jgi:hypothetical protein